jgi:hypothetical protein
MLKRDAQMEEELQAQSTQHIPSTVKVEGVQESESQEANARNEQEIPEVQKELGSTSGQSKTSMQEQMELVLQNPQQCTEMMQLCMARIEVLTLFTSVLRLRLMSGPSTEEEVDTHSKHSTANGLPVSSTQRRNPFIR